MIDEQVLRSVLQSHTELIYNLLEREERRMPLVNEEKIELQQKFKEAILGQIERMIT